jgi:hypothetical protein
VLYQLSYTPNGSCVAADPRRFKHRQSLKGKSEAAAAPVTTCGLGYFNVFCKGWLGARAHSRFAPVPGAFSNTQRVGGFPQTLSSCLKPTQCPSGDRYPGPPLQPHPVQAGRSGQAAWPTAIGHADEIAAVASTTKSARE